MSESRGIGLHPLNALFLLGFLALLLAWPVGSWVADQFDSEPSRGGTDSGVRLRIVSPAPEAEVTSPFVLEVASEGVTIADPAEGVEGAFHYHVFDNFLPFTPAGGVIPERAGIYHFWADSIELDLLPGEHQLVLVLGGNDEVRPADLPATEVTITVVE